jgi:hypothetical protein
MPYVNRRLKTLRRMPEPLRNLYLSSLAIASSEPDCSRHILSITLVGAGRPRDVYFIAKYLIQPQKCTRTLS